MKKRIGFVSNSSSCSFLIYGLYFDTEESFNEYFQGEPADTLDFEDISYYYPYDSAAIFIGASLDQCDDNQTMGEFKKQVEKKLQNVAKKEIPNKLFSIYEEAWHD